MKAMLFRALILLRCLHFTCCFTQFTTLYSQAYLTYPSAPSTAAVSSVHLIRSSLLFAKLPSWMNRPEEQVIIKDTPVVPINEGTSLFDSLLVDVSDETEVYSISRMTLQDIAESYSFSLAYLGDFVIELGCKTPLDVNTRISNFMLGDQIASLLEAVTSLDPNEVNEGYDSIQIGELADELGLSDAQMSRLCLKEMVNLPFGFETVVHQTIAMKIRDMVSMGEYVDDFVDVAAAIEKDLAGDGANDGKGPSFGGMLGMR